MTSSTSLYVRIRHLLSIVLLCAYGCSSTATFPDATGGDRPIKESGTPAIAILPVVNFSNTPAPLDSIDRQWRQGLKKRGLNLLDADIVERVITRNRIRYTGGLDPVTAQAFKTQADADAVLVMVLELYSDVQPPKIALNARLVSTSPQTRILWIDGIGLAGDDAPGLLDLGLIEDPARLAAKALDDLADSLARHLSPDPGPDARQSVRRNFRPQMSFQSLELVPGKTYRVAVVPFFNLSERKRAGDFMALLFARALSVHDNITIIEPGTVRQQLLDLRIIMPSGISLANADLVFHRLNADLILNGEVLDYQDYRGASGSPKVDFSAQLIEKNSREVVWTAKSYKRGDDGVYFFDWGKAHTAHELARQMVALAVEDMIE
ncbi:MAG: hypothetical protein P8X96_07670 [Desulfobacteraceae bacterium]